MVEEGVRGADVLGMDKTQDRSGQGGGGVGGRAGGGDAPEGGGWNGLLDRRSGLDRRDFQRAMGGGSGEDLGRRRGAGRRLSDFTKSAEEGEFTKEQFLFVQGVEAFKRANAKAYPTWTDVLEVIRLLGYRKTARSEIELRNAEDWLEAPDAESGVRPKGWEKRSGGRGKRGEAA